MSIFARLRPKKSLSRLLHSNVDPDLLLSDLYTAVRKQRFEDIVVIRTDFKKSPFYLLLASSFNARHLARGTESVNRIYKQSIKDKDQEFCDFSISQNWNVLDFKHVVLHLFEPKTREQYDIEQLWGVGEQYDDLVNIPAESTKILDYKYYLDKVIKEKEVEKQKLSELVSVH